MGGGGETGIIIPKLSLLPILIWSSDVLIYRGADINAKNDRGDTPLHISAYRGFLEILRLLVRAGADVLLRNGQDKTPQEEAAAGGHDQAAKYLLSIMEGNTCLQPPPPHHTIPNPMQTENFKGRLLVINAQFKSLMEIKRSTRCR